MLGQRLLLWQLLLEQRGLRSGRCGVCVGIRVHVHCSGCLAGARGGGG